MYGRFKPSFNELARAFHLGIPDSQKYLTPKYLTDTNPWQALASVLVHAQHGDFSQLSRVIDLMNSYDEYLFWTACTELVSNAAPTDMLGEFIAAFWHGKRDPGTQTFLSIALSKSYKIAAVEKLLELHALAEEEEPRYEIERNLSFLLEPANGMLWEGAEESTDYDFGETDDDEPDIVTRIDTDAYATEVRKQRDKVLQGLGADGAWVYEGVPFDVIATANRLVKRLSSQSIEKDRMIRERMAIEANTGISFEQARDKQGNLIALPALAILETFLESDEVARFQPGQRYFFGHEIPD